MMEIKLLLHLIRFSSRDIPDFDDTVTYIQRCAYCKLLRNLLREIHKDLTLKQRSDLSELSDALQMGRWNTVDAIIDQW